MHIKIKIEATKDEFDYPPTAEMTIKFDGLDPEMGMIGADVLATAVVPALKTVIKQHVQNSTKEENEND